MKHTKRKYSRETQVGAAADYLLGIPTKEIYITWNVPVCTFTHWIRKAGFKTRHRRGRNNSSDIPEEYRDG